MSEARLHPEVEADRRADRRTWIYFSIFLLASFLEKSFSDQYDLQRAGAAHPAHAWLSQATSHLVIFCMVPFITLMLSRYPPFSSQWRRNLAIHAAATVVFSVVHILLMVALRELLMPVFFGFTYDFGLTNPSVWLYEYRKDVLSYLLIAGLFALNRLAEQRVMEARAAHNEASERHRLTLKSGGRTFFLEPADVIWAKAASNYVEVTTPHKTHLARMTLAELERLLDEAGGAHERVHRSYIVHTGHIREITPTGDGDVTITLDTGASVPGSRKYRDRLPGTPGEESRA